MYSTLREYLSRYARVAVVVKLAESNGDVALRVRNTPQQHAEPRPSLACCCATAPKRFEH